MVIEASRVLKQPVTDTSGRACGMLDRPVFSANEGRVFGFQVSQGSLVTKFKALNYHDILNIGASGAVIDTEQVLGKELKELDAVAKEAGPLLGVKARTESGKSLGRVTDVLIDAETGFIVRFYLRNLMMERIIPRQFLVSITPREVIFKEIVDTPIFNQVATELGASPAV